MLLMTLFIFPKSDGPLEQGFTNCKSSKSASFWRQKQLRKNYIISFGSPVEACNMAYSIAVYDSFLFLQQWAIIFLSY